MKSSTIFITLTLILIFGSGTNMSLASETVYGRQLMTEQERNKHRAKRHSFKTQQEREDYRREHHQQMQQRAKQRGVTLPDEPQPMGKGMRGPAGGAGQGMGGGAGQNR